MQLQQLLIMIRNQLAKRKLNKTRDEKAINIIKAAFRRNYAQPQYNEMMEQDIIRIKGIRDYENKLKQKRIQLTKEDTENEAQRIKRIRDYENKLKQERIHLNNEIKGINYERKMKQKRINTDEAAIMRRIEANKARIEKEREIKAAANKLQSVYRGHMGRKEATNEKIRKAYLNYIPPPQSPSVSGDTTLSQLTTPALSRSPSVVGGIEKNHEKNAAIKGLNVVHIKKKDQLDDLAKLEKNQDWDYGNDIIQKRKWCTQQKNNS